MSGKPVFQISLLIYDIPFGLKQKSQVGYSSQIG